MPTLAELKKQRAEIDHRIRDEKRRAKAKKREDALEQHGVRIVCLQCKGTGSTWSGGADPESDPPWEETCDGCAGCGFVWAIRFDEVGDYSLRLEYDDRERG